MIAELDNIIMACERMKASLVEKKAKKSKKMAEVVPEMVAEVVPEVVAEVVPEMVAEVVQKVKKPKKSKKMAEVIPEVVAETPHPELPSSPVVEKKAKKEKREVKKTRPPTEYQIFTSEISKLVKEALPAGTKMKRGFHQKVAGYMKQTAKTAATLENVRAAMQYLNDHPEYKSAHMEKMSSRNSVASEKAKLD